MEDSTIRTIYALKNGDKSFDEVVAEYWSNYTGVPTEYYGENTLMQIAQGVFLDYINTADNPRYEIWNLFDNMRFDYKSICKSEDSFDKRIRNAIWTTLVLTDVRDKGEFVNGFRELND